MAAEIRAVDFLFSRAGEFDFPLVGRGNFTAVFLVQCLQAIGCKTIHLEDS